MKSLVEYSPDLEIPAQPDSKLHNPQFTSVVAKPEKEANTGSPNNTVLVSSSSDLAKYSSACTYFNT